MEITHNSKLLDVLEAYPALEEQIVHIAPPFKNLKNPVLRRTVGRLATLTQVAQVGGMDADRLVNTLRKAVGQAELQAHSESTFKIEIEHAQADPEWTVGEPQFTVNGTALLERGEVPLGKVNDLLNQLTPGRYLLLATNFEPSPILEAMQKQGRRVFHKALGGEPHTYLTFIA